MLTKHYNLLEASRLLSISIDTLRYYIRKKQLPANRVGKRYIVSNSDLEDFVTNNQKVTNNG